MRFKRGDRVLLLPGKCVRWCGQPLPDIAWLTGTIVGDHHWYRDKLYWGVQFDGRPHESDVADYRLVPLLPTSPKCEATTSDASAEPT